MDNNHSPLPIGNRWKQSGGIAFASLLIFGAVAGVLTFSQKSAFAAVNIAVSSSKFFGPSLVRALITDTSKTLSTDSITVHVEAKHGSSSLGATDITVNAISTSGTFELFVTTSNSPVSPAAPTFTTAPGPFIVRISPTAAAANINEKAIVTAPTSPLKDGDSVVITYGGQTSTIQFAKTIATASTDRTTAGNGNNIALDLTDQDANTDPTQIVSFSATGASDIVLASGTGVSMNLTGANFVETGQNTGVFELVVAVNAPRPLNGGNLTVTSFPTSVTFTVGDKDVYAVLTGATAPYGVITPATSTVTATTGVTLQNTDGVISTTAPFTVANGLALQINDPDRNIDTKTKDTFSVANRVNVTVAGVTTGAITTIPFQESDLNTGLFLPQLSSNAITLNVVSGASSVSGTSLNLNASIIAGGPDVTVTYLDPAGSPTGTKLVKLVTHIVTDVGSITGPSSVPVNGKLSLTIHDKDFVINSGSIDSFVVKFAAGVDTSKQVTFPTGVGLGNMTLKVKGDGIKPASDLNLAFIETSAGSGVFTASNIDMTIINGGTDAVTAAPVALKDGDQVAFKLYDEDQSPPTTSSATITIAKPTVGISVDRTSIPLPRSGTSDDSKLVVTITDPSLSTNPSSTNTFSFASTNIVITDSNGGIGITPASLNIGTASFTETGPGTGIYTATYDIENLAAVSNTLLNAAKIKFTYTPSGGSSTSTSVNLKAYDASLTTSESVLHNGDNLTITVSDPNQNRDPATAEQISLTVQGKSDDQTLVTFSDLTETGTNTGVYTKTVIVGKDFKIGDSATNKFSTTVEIHYNQPILSDASAVNQDKELDLTIGTDSGTLSVTPDVIGPGSKLHIDVHDRDLNTNPAGVVTITGSNDYVKVTTNETGVGTATPDGEESAANSGIFESTLQLSPILKNGIASFPIATGTKDITATVLPGDVISVRYTDQKDANGAKVLVSKTIQVKSFDPTFNASATSIAPGDSPVVTVSDLDANTDPTTVDSIQLKVTSDSDPIGTTVSALESGADTGVFTAPIPTSGTVTTGSVFLKVGDLMYIKYTDKFPADYAQRVNNVFNPSKDFTFTIPVGVSISPGGNVNATTPSMPATKNLQGGLITSITTGQQILLTTDIHNNQATSQPFFAIIEVRDSNGVTVAMVLVSGTLSPNGVSTAGGAWIPDTPGTYTLRTFVVSNLQNPIVLSNPVQTQATVS